MRFISWNALSVRGILGVGSSGEVLEVEETATGNRYALKSSPWLGGQEELIALARLRHPNLVNLEAICVKGQHWLPLTAVLEAGELSRALLDFWSASEGVEIRFERWLADALRGLAFLHAQQLIHGDIKPTNLLIGKDGRLRLSDLGLARAVGAPEMGGTPAFMAPERMRGASSSAAADLFSLGVTFASVADSSRPWRVWPLLQQLQHPDANQRPTSAREVARALAHLTENADLGRESFESARAYLTSPQPQGRERLLNELEHQLTLARTSRGGVWVLRTSAGAGATRILKELSLRTGLEILDGPLSRLAELKFPLLRTFDDGPLHAPLLLDRADLAPEAIQKRLVEWQKMARAGERVRTFLVVVQAECALEGSLLSRGSPSFEVGLLDEAAITAWLNHVFPPFGTQDRLARWLIRHFGATPRDIYRALECMQQKGLIFPGVLVEHAPPAPEQLDPSLPTLQQVDRGALPVSVVQIAAQNGVEWKLLGLIALSSQPLPQNMLRRALFTLTKADGQPFELALQRWVDLGMLAGTEPPSIDGETRKNRIVAHMSDEEKKRGRTALVEILESMLEHNESVVFMRLEIFYHRLNLGDATARATAKKLAQQLLDRGHFEDALLVMQCLQEKTPLEPDERVLLARILIRRNRFDEGLEQARLAQESGNERARWITGEVWMRQGNHKKAVEVLAPHYESTPDQKDLAALYVRSLVSTGAFPQVIEVCRTQLADMSSADIQKTGTGFEVPEAAIRLELLMCLATALLHTARYDEARSEFAAANDVATVIEDVERLAEIEQALSQIAELDGDYPTAIRHCETAVRWMELSGNPLRIVTRITQLELLKFQRDGRISPLLAALSRLQNLADVYGHPTLTASALGHCAHVYVFCGQIQQAIEAAHQAIALAQNSGQNPIVLAAKIQLGEAFRLRGDLDQAHLWIEAARVLAEEQGQEFRLLHVMMASVRIHIDAQNYQEALEQAIQCRKRAHAANLVLEEIEALRLGVEASLYLPEIDRKRTLSDLFLARSMLYGRWTRDNFWRINALMALVQEQDPPSAAYFAQQTFDALDVEMRNFEQDERRTFMLRSDRAEIVRRLTPLLNGQETNVEKVQQLQRVLEINQQISQELNLRRLLERIVDAAVELCGAERGFVLLASAQTTRALEVFVARNIDREVVYKRALKVSRSIAEEVMKQGKSTLIVDALVDQKFSNKPSVVAIGLRSVLCAPLQTRGTTIGVLYVDHRFRVRAFQDSHREALETFANQAAIAVSYVRALEAATAAQRYAEAARDRLQHAKIRLEEQVAEKNWELELARRREREGGVSNRLVTTIIGDSPAMTRLLDQLEKVVPSELPVLIMGESGTGKELVARALHDYGPRKGQAFISVNCGALPDNLLESELFGHVRGAFTGADRDHEGLFCLARGGTLFLDEVGDMSSAMQVKLLRALQDGEIRPVGGRAPVRVDVRVVAATNRDLAAMIRERGFREDLYYRLRVISLQLPPLRERLEDLVPLCNHFLATMRRPDGKAGRVSSDALTRLRQYRWPGNVRELRAVLQSSLVFSPSEVITGAELDELLANPLGTEDSLAKGSNLAGPTVTNPTRDIQRLAATEAEAVRRALETTGGNKAEAARRLGIGRKTLYEKMARFGIG